MLFHRAQVAPPDFDVFACTATDLVGKAFILTDCFVLPARLSAEDLQRSLFFTIESRIRKAGARLVRRETVRTESSASCSADDLSA